jgi:hypothetical protein
LTTSDEESINDGLEEVATFLVSFGLLKLKKN